MKYQIMGFNQEKAVEFGLDLTDLCILRWLSDFEPNMSKKQIDGETYFWVKYQAILDDLPILKIKGRALKYRLEKLVEKNILKHKLIINKGKFSYYHFDEKYNEMNCITHMQQIAYQNNPSTKEINNIYSPSSDEQDSSSLPKEQELAQNFNKIWKNYPRKDGKNKAYQHYKAWLKGRNFIGETKKFTDKEMYWAVKVYAYECDRDKIEKKFIQMGSTFFNDTIESKVNRYNKYPEGWEQKINEWEKNKNENL